MKYFLDTEFHETSKETKSFFNKKSINTIELISIGLVCEDGREYYAINKECDLKAIWNDDWLRENVLKGIWIELIGKESDYGKTYHNRLMSFSYRGMKNLFKWHGKTISAIADDVLRFIIEEPCDLKHVPIAEPQPEFYAYYADYDWVVFCWLFGRMIDLPRLFPMYCRDLKQMMDEEGLDDDWKDKNCPAAKNEHNALADARWNHKLYKEIVTHKEYQKDAFIEKKIKSKGVKKTKPANEKDKRGNTKQAHGRKRNISNKRNDKRL